MWGSGCHKNCHLKCTLPKSFDKEVIKRCACLGCGEVCKVCGHAYNLHFHNERKHVYKETIENFVDEKMEKEFEKAKTQEERQQALQRKFKREREKSEKEKKRLAEKLTRDITEFENMSISRSYVKVIQSQLYVIEVRLEGSVGKETEPLMKTKEELEKKIKIVQGQI